MVNGSLITHPPEVLQHWVEHFSVLTQFRCSSNPTLQDVHEKIPIIEAQTHVDSDITLDTPFALEDIEAAVNHLKKDSSGGPDSLSPHHLRHAGSLLKEWLCKIFNSITDLEAIPASFKAGIVIPVYKGKGKDPLSPKATEELLSRLSWQTLDGINFLSECVWHDMVCVCTVCDQKTFSEAAPVIPDVRNPFTTMDGFFCT